MNRAAWLVLCSIPAGCAFPPPTPADTPPAQVTPTVEPATPGPPVASDCDATSSEVTTLRHPGLNSEGLAVDGLPAVGVPALLYAPGLTGHVSWRACNGTERVVGEGHNWTSITFPSLATWTVLATDEWGRQSRNQIKVGNHAGVETVFGDVTETPDEDGFDVLKWPFPSELFRNQEGNIDLDADDITDLVPDSLTGVGGVMAEGIRKSWLSMPGFPLWPTLVLKTAAGIDVSQSLPSDPTGFTQPGAGAWLMETVDGQIRSDSVRYPLHFKYVDQTGLDGKRERQQLRFWLPDGLKLKEDRDYLWVVTTSTGGSKGPLRPPATLQRLLQGPVEGEPATATHLRTLIYQAVASQPDLPNQDLVAAAGYFHTRSFRWEMEAISACIEEKSCDQIERGRTDVAEPRVEFDNLWVYSSAVKLEGSDPSVGPRSLDLLMGAAGERFPSDDYAMVAFGDVDATVWQTEDQAGLSGPFQIEGNKVVPQRKFSLRFSLILPHAPPPEQDRYPVVIFVHGLGQDQMDAFLEAEFLARYGFAVLAIDQVGHGSRLSVLGKSSGDGINNLLAASQETIEGDASSETWLEGDGLNDARVKLGDGYATLAILDFFNYLQNFRGMGDNFRQGAADVLQLEAMLRHADDVGGLNDQLRKLGAPYDVSTQSEMSFGRSLGSITLGVHLPFATGRRAAVFGVPGAGVISHLTAHSPFIGQIITVSSSVLECLARYEACDSPLDALDLASEGFPPSSEYLEPGDVVTGLLQGLLEPGDPAVYAQDWLHRDRPTHILMQHVCDDEVVPNPATDYLAVAGGIPVLLPVDVDAEVAVVGPLDQMVTPSVYDDGGDRGLTTPDRTGVSGNVDGQTAALLSYCPGTHSGLYDREQSDEDVEFYKYYPDGPLQFGPGAVFPQFNSVLSVDNAYHDSREAVVNFLVSFNAFPQDAPVITAPGVRQLDDVDSDGIPAGGDQCPYGTNITNYQSGTSGSCP